MDTTLEELVSSLHPLERALLPALRVHDTFEDLVRASGLKDVEAMRAIQWLSNKGVLRIEEEAKTFILLDENGKNYAESGLPETRFLHAIDGETRAEIVMKRAKLKAEEFQVCIGLLKRQLAITITKDAGGRMVFSLTGQGEKLKKQKSASDVFLTKPFPVSEESLKDLDRHVCLQLLSRKQILRKEEVKRRRVVLTKLGRSLLGTDIKGTSRIGAVTPELIKSGDFDALSFRRFDVQSEVPKLARGKEHFVEQAISFIRRIWVEMGFEEMTGDCVQTSFWDLDVLFVPQDHPARSMQDTFYLKDQKKSSKEGPVVLLGDLPPGSFPNGVPDGADRVRAAHESGGSTGSKGWQVQWSKTESKEVLLRTHTTVLSARMLASLRLADLPKKYFSIGKVFRNESLDWKHLFSFYQIEGIVVCEGMTMRHLIGFLETFFRKMGYSRIRVRPHHFPYTEPSVEVDVWNEARGQWVEIAGAGIFRPEVTKTIMGVEVPVLAWGMGLERVIAEYYGITDIRDLYNNDVVQLQEMKEFLR